MSKAKSKSSRRQTERVHVIALDQNIFVFARMRNECAKILLTDKKNCMTGFLFVDGFCVVTEKLCVVRFVVTNCDWCATNKSCCGGKCD